MLIESRPAHDPELAALGAPNDDATYLVVVLDGRAVAYGAWRHAPGGAAELTGIYVRPAFRGRGIARQLIVAIEEDAFAAGRPVIRLETGTDLPAAIALCRSAGYHRVAAGFEKRLGVLVQ